MDPQDQKKCDASAVQVYITYDKENNSMQKTSFDICLATPDKCAVDCGGDRARCSLHKSKENIPVELQEILKEFSDRIKTEFYYEFEELIPSIMAERLDSIKEDLLKEYRGKKII